MTSNQLRNIARKMVAIRGAGLPAGGGNLASLLRSTSSLAPGLQTDRSLVGSSHRGISTKRIARLQKDGILDDKALLSFETLHELQVNSRRVFRKNSLFGTHKVTKDDKESFEWMSYEDFGKCVDKTRSVLKDLGAQEFSRIGIISNNRWEWAAIATAAYSLNATVVPMYEAQLPADWTYILNDSGCTVLFCSTEEIFKQVQREVLPSAPSVKSCLCLDGKLGEPYAFATAMERADTTTQIIKPTVDDLADLIYTSGTTGKPKGVELTHLNLSSNVKAGVHTMVEGPDKLFRPSDRTLAFLPWAHSYGQTCELWGVMSQGSSTGVCRGVPNILDDLQLVKPTMLFAVPTLYKRIYDGVHNMMESSSPVRRALMRRALEIGRRKVEAESGFRQPLGMLERFQHRMLDSLVLSKIRNRFGGRMRQAFVAGAACPVEVIGFMDSIGVPLCEGYGLTETSPIICINTPQNRKPGSVGQPLEGIKVHIMMDGEEVPPGEEGEICCVGPNVMRSYYKNPEATEEVISIAPDGKSRMFHTGDLGRMDGDGFVKVTGRLKEQYKLENGKYVVPTPIEEAIGMSRFISQVVLSGANRPYNIALIVPDWVSIRSELDIKGHVTDEDLVNDKRVKSLIDAEIVAHCYKLKKFEVPTRWGFVAPFTAANNMLTPKMSIRRHKVIQAYQDLIQKLYGEKEQEEHEEDQGAKAA